MRTLIATSILVLAASTAIAATSQQDGDTLTIKLNTVGTDHTTKTGIVVHDTIHGTLANGDKFTARIYTPGLKKCTTDSDCERKNPHVK